VGVGIGAAEAQADARRDVAVLTVEHQRLAQRIGHAIGDGERVVLAGDAAQQDRELVATEAGDDVVGAQHVAEAIGDGAQQPVAGAVAERVVDDLEVVEVDEQHGDVAGAPRQRAVEALEEELAVGQAGERVVLGLPGELALGLLARGDVDAVADPRVGLALAAGQRRVVPQAPAAAVAVAQLELRRGGRERAAGEVLGDDEVGQRHADDVVAHARAQRRVGLLHDAVEPDERHPGRRAIEGRAEALLAVLGRRARVLVQAPVDDVDDAEAGDEERVDRRPAPRVGDGVGVVVDGGGLERAHQPVVGQDVREGEQVGEPLLVERQQADHHEEVEVALDGAVHQVHDDRRRAQQADARGGRAPAAGVAPARREGARNDNRRHVERGVPERVADDQAPHEEGRALGPEDAQHPHMASTPHLGGQGAPGWQPGVKAREGAHTAVVG
jgi:hypothetical protein